MICRSVIHIAALFLYIFSLPLWALEAEVDRTTIGLSETFRLTIKDQEDLSSIDLSPLKQDFEVLSQQSQTNLQSINGSFTKETVLLLELAPKKVGELLIPALQAGKVATQPIKVTVHRKAAQDMGKPDLAIVDTKTNVTKVYEQQQLIFAVKLATLLPVRSGTLTTPEVKNAIIKKLDEVQGREVIGKQNYYTLTRYYAVFPQNSGKLTLPSVSFSGELEQSQFGFTILSARAVSDPVSVEVIPPAYKEDFWLPAADISLDQKWNPNPEAGNSVIVGQALNYEIHLSVADLMAEQLPPLKLHIQAPDAKYYPDKTNVRNHLTSLGVVGELNQSWVILPTRPGDLVVPELKLSWWNTKKNQQETLVIPGKTFKVIADNSASHKVIPDDPANPGASSTALYPPDHLLNKSKPLAETDEIKAPEHAAKQALGESDHGLVSFTSYPWFWVALVFCLLWLLSLVFIVFLLLRRSRVSRLELSANQLQHGAKNKNSYFSLPVHRLLSCLEQQHFQEFRSLVLSWANRNFSMTNLVTPVLSLTAMVNLLAPYGLAKGLADLLAETDRLSFSNTDHEHGLSLEPAEIQRLLIQLEASMEQYFACHQLKGKAKIKAKFLKPLYPE